MMLTTRCPVLMKHSISSKWTTGWLQIEYSIFFRAKSAMKRNDSWSRVFSFHYIDSFKSQCIYFNTVIKRIPRLAEANIRHIGEYVLIIVNWLAHYSIPILPRLKPHNPIDGRGVARSVKKSWSWTSTWRETVRIWVLCAVAVCFQKGLLGSEWFWGHATYKEKQSGSKQHLKIKLVKEDNLIL